MTSQRCAHCGTKLRGAPAFCPSCGARLVRADGAEVELELVERGSAPVESEVVFERPTGRRGKAIGLGVAAVLAVGIGASVLSDGNGGDTATPATTTVAPGPTTAVELPATTAVVDAGASTTSTTLGPFYVAPGPLLGQPTELSLAVALGSELYVIDADTGTATPVGYGNVNEGQSSVLTSVGVVVNDINGAPLLLRPGAAKPEPLVADEPDGSGPLAGPMVYAGEGPPGRLWVMRYGIPAPVVGYVDAGIGSTELVKVDGVGGAFGATQAADGIGGFLFSSAGGTYRVDGTGSTRRISPGVLVDASYGHALVTECDEAYVCGFRGIDVASGQSWTFADTAPRGETSTTSPVLSPDGRRFARLVLGDDSSISLGRDADIDVVGVDGTETFRAPVSGFGGCGFGGCASPLVWSSDGRWLLALRSSDSFWAWRSNLAAPIVVELPAAAPVTQPTFSLLLGVRPAASMPVRPA